MDRVDGVDAGNRVDRADRADRVDRFIFISQINITNNKYPSSGPCFKAK